MLNGSKFFLFHLDLLKTQSSNGFSFELTIRFYRQILLQKIKLKDTNICTFCRRETETIEHILWDCEKVQAQLDDFVTFCSNMIHRHFPFAKITFIPGSCEKKDTVKNRITLQIKYHIYGMR